MATRSFIGKIYQGGITGVYCHFDGYPGGVGAALQRHYTDPLKVDALLELGSLSSLGLSIEQTVAYARDRGEPLADPLFYGSEEALTLGCREIGMQYAYVFDSGQWTTLNIFT
jgi:hypothetical protein